MGLQLRQLQCLSMMTPQGIVGSNESGQEDIQDWSDIESELYCSTREACAGYLLFAESESDAEQK